LNFGGDWPQDASHELFVNNALAKFGVDDILGTQETNATVDYSYFAVVAKVSTGGFSMEEPDAECHVNLYASRNE
jgi:hypothetical protein